MNDKTKMSITSTAGIIPIGWFSSTYNINIEADEAMPQMEDDSNTSESNY